MKTVKGLWNKWKEVAEKIGNFQAGVIFSILYFLIIVPTGLIANLVNDYFRIKSFPAWEKVEDNSSTLSKLKEQ